MALSAGTRLGPYEILKPLGAGGMGEVYRARDIRLERDVAVKVLPAELSQDADSLHRFEREARLAGSLNHPNILTVFDVGAHAGAPYLVTELLEGRTLRETLTGGPLPIRKALDYAQQIAHGLAAAHAREIIHRDLKPANLFVTRDGLVEILDFGLAKLTHPPKESSDSEDSTRTGEGRIGTAGYMSPEQVRGLTVDARTDIFAFGAVLYEMLTGERAFSGETKADTLTAILTRDPEAMARPGRDIPTALERLVRRCLEKDPDERFQSIRDVAFALDVESDLNRSEEADRSVAHPDWRRWAVTAAIALLAAGAGAWASQLLWSSPPPPPRLTQLTFRRGLTEPARFTADGHTIVFSAFWDGRPPEVRSRRLDQTESVSLGLPPAQLLSVSSRGELAILLYPPDERAPNRLGTLARVPLSGGPVRPVLEDVAAADWSPDGQELAVVRCQGGRCQAEYPMGRVLYAGIDVRSLNFLRVSPQGDRIALIDGEDLVVADQQGQTARMEVGPRGGGSGDLYGLAWSPRGDALLVTAADLGRSRTLRRVALDGTVTELYGAPGEMVIHDIARDGRILLHQGHHRLGVRGKAPSDGEEHELLGVPQALCRGYSADGTRVLMTSLSSLVTYLGALDGQAPMRLGDGFGNGLSADGDWAVIRPSDASQSELVLTPTAAGEALSVDLPYLGTPTESWVDYWSVWHVDAEWLGFVGAEPGRPLRGFVFERSTGQTRAVTPEGTIALPGLTPDDHVLAWGKDGSLSFHPIAGGDPRPVGAHLVVGEGEPIRVGADGRSLFLKAGRVPVRVERLELATGQRTLWKVVQPPDPTGVWGTLFFLLTPDGEGYVYSYGRALNDLYLLEGLEF